MRNALGLGQEEKEAERGVPQGMMECSTDMESEKKKEVREMTSDGEKAGSALISFCT